MQTKLPLSLFKKIIFSLFNLVGKKNEYRVIVTSPNYVEFRFLWGLISFEKGEKKEFLIQGTETYVNKVIDTLSKKNLDTQKILKK